MSISTSIAAFTKHEEGAYTNDVRDSGNWSSGIAGHGTLIGSNAGVGAPAAIAWMHPHESTVTAAWMRGAGVAAIWTPLATVKYWRPLSCDHVHPALALMLFDYGWNRGPASSARQLQEVLGLAGDDQDGDIGPQTLGLVDQVNDLAAFLARLADVQDEHYHSLSNFSTYGAGWLARTERRVTRALNMLSTPTGA